MVSKHDSGYRMMTSNNNADNRMEQLEQQLADLTAKSTVWETKMEELYEQKQSIVDELKEFIKQQFEEMFGLNKEVRNRGNDQTNPPAIPPNTNRGRDANNGTIPPPNGGGDENCGTIHGSSKVIGELDKLKQEGTEIAYLEKFEMLKSYTVTMNRSLTKVYFITSLISGLQEEVEATVFTMEPVPLMQAFHCVKLQEVTLEAAARQMYKNTFQSDFLLILYILGSKPLQIWDKEEEEDKGVKRMICETCSSLEDKAVEEGKRNVTTMNKK